MNPTHRCLLEPLSWISKLPFPSAWNILKGFWMSPVLKSFWGKKFFVCMFPLHAPCLPLCLPAAGKHTLLRMHIADLLKRVFSSTNQACNCSPYWLKSSFKHLFIQCHLWNILSRGSQFPSEPLSSSTFHYSSLQMAYSNSKLQHLRGPSLHLSHPFSWSSFFHFGLKCPSLILFL